MSAEPNKPSTISKEALCRDYNISPATLRNWMGNEKFKEKLEPTGYIATQRLLTPEQHRIFREHFGEP